MTELNTSKLVGLIYAMTVYKFNFTAANSLPSNIYFGTSTWTYPGWKGLIYNRAYKNEKEFRARCLAEYANNPLFKCVGIDRSFYRPLTSDVLKGYANLVPEHFRWASKVWERITIPVFPRHARYGDLAGSENPDFLNVDLFIEKVLRPYELDQVKMHTGPFIFQFPVIQNEVLERIQFIPRLGSFLKQLPAQFLYATEIRNPELLNTDYFNVLNSTGATHCFNYWNFMPPLIEQMKAAAAVGGLHAPFFVARILTPPRVSYQQAVKLFEPYHQIKRPDPRMRADVIRLIKRALVRGSKAYIIVNNRCEGNSPMTINEIVSTLYSKRIIPVTTSG